MVRLLRVSLKRSALIALAALVSLAAVSACGDDSTTSSTTTFAPEIAQPLPKLPPGWKARRDGEIGYAIGIPPGWERREKGGNVLFRAPDHLVAMTLSVDRNGDALTLPLREFATRTLAALPGFQARVRPTKAKRFQGTPLDAVEASGTGTTAGQGIEERATVVVLRRDQVVNYTVAIVENAQRGYSKLDRAVALRMVRTLRDQPVARAVSPEAQ